MYVYTKITLYQISIQYSMDYIDAKRVPPARPRTAVWGVS